MGHWKHKAILFLLIFTANLYYINGCSVIRDPEVSPFGIPHAFILDTFRGTFWQNQTTGIVDIDPTATDGRGYYNIQIVDSRFVLSTTDLFEKYEEREVTEIMSITTRFICTDGSNSAPFSVWINVRDTNNNPPTFLLPPEGEFFFTIAAPVPPGYEITGCLNDLIVRDIDLTTEKIIFEIEENPYFEIEREIFASSATPKEFSAIIRTKTFIRNIPERIRLQISATDYDRTDDDPITKTAYINVIGNSDFELPEEPVFSEAIYFADYTDDDRVVLTTPITLRSGYDELVKFDIIGDFSDNFVLESNPDQENQRSIRVDTPLEGEVLKKRIIHLIVTAEREHTSGASATIVLRLPEVVPLEFERAHYEGTIENNNARIPQLILTQGYAAATVTATVRNDYFAYFTASVQGNAVTLSMSPLDESIIEDNSFLNLEVVATNGFSTATTVVTLEIIKEDNITPVFNKAVYTGAYEPADFTIDEIVLVQGHDGIDAVDLYGENKNYFKAKLTGTTVTVEVSDPIPPEIYSEGQILLSLEVRKPRTVGASAAIIINLPAARELKFGASIHRGSWQDNVLSLDPIPLIVGYDSSVVFSITGDYEDYFTVSSGQNPAVIVQKAAIPDVLLQNNIITLNLVASGPNAITTTTSVLLDIIKDDTTTPVFSRNIYYGTYLGPSQVNIDDIKLSQGFDSGVTFTLAGEHAQYFRIQESDGNNVVVVPRSSIPEDVIMKEKVLVFNVLATKTLTVGANAAISINFPTELTERAIIKFSQNTYIGSIDSTNLAADSIVLSSGYEPGTQFILNGDFKDHFTLTPHDNNAHVLSLSLTSPLPVAATENTFIVLEVEARRERAVSGWTSVVIEIIRQEVVAPVFAQAYYRGAYNAESGLQFNQEISLSRGYDETVSFDLDGEFRSLFSLNSRGPNSLSIIAPAPIANDLLQAHNQFILTVVATKPGTLAARSVVSIEIEKDLTDRAILRFSQNTYIGSIDSTNLAADSIVLSSGYEPGTQFILNGDFKDHFTLTPHDNNAHVLSLSLTSPLPVAATENTFIVLEVEARRERAVSGWTSVVIEIIRQEVVAPVFAQAYYRGAYSAESGLQFNHEISLSHGYDETVSFDLDGEFRSLFSLKSRGPNSLSIIAPAPIANDLLQAHNQFILTVIATKPGTLAARSAVSIDIEKDLTDRAILRFSQNTYIGSIDSTNLAADSIVLSSGYEPGTQFILNGDFKDHFTLTPHDNNAHVLSLSLTSPLPVAATENTFIVLEVEARRERAVSGWTSVVIEIIRQEVVAPVFAQAYYRGAYSAESGLQFNQEISLSHGYDETVSFDLDGEFRSLFSLNSRGPNSLSIIAPAPIANDLLQAHNQFILTVVATKPGTLAARSAVSIDIEKDLTDRAILRFSQNTYIGSIDSTNLAADSIVLSSGYEPGTQFILNGDFKDHFTLTPHDNNAHVLSLSLTSPLPVAATENTFIVLEVEARRERAVSGWTSVVIEIIRQEVVAPVFAQAYYRGAYSAESGLQFNQEISLSHGYDETVSFDVDGEFRSLFSLNSRGPNSLSIIAPAPIANDLLQAHNQFILTVVATKPGTLAARSVVSIDIEKDLTDRAILRFSQNTYIGSIDSTNLAADSIVLSSGYEPGTQFILNGDFKDHFTLTPHVNNAHVLSLSLTSPLPVAATENTFIVLEVEARRERAVSGWTSVVIEIIRQEVVAPVFAQAYYRGAYNAESGLQFNQEISLSHGYDETVSFDLDGEFRSLFSLNSRGPNSLSIIAPAPIANDLLQAHNQFILTVVATKPGTLAARSAVSIDIEKDLTDRAILRFTQNTYIGSIDSTNLAADSIVLSSGYEPGTQFILNGDFKDHFTLTPHDNNAHVLSLSLISPLPVAATENTFIVLEVEARRERAVSGWTSIVIEIIRQEIVAPVFAQAYYRGAYNAESGLQFNQEISLSHGYDETVSFDLDGEFRSLFSLNSRGPNSLSIIAPAPIANDLLQAHNQFILTVIATKPGTLAARSAVSIDIEKDLTDRAILRFSQNTYIGSIDSTNLAADSIVLSSGYEPGTQFILNGDFKDHFTLTPHDNNAHVLSLSLISPLPVAANEKTFIVLEVEARRERAVSGWTSIVIEIIRQEVVAPVFAQAYYRGAYNAESGLQFNQDISLSHGYDETVSFDLEGEFRSLFSLNSRGPNSLSIIAPAPIANDLLQAHNQFILTVVATKPGTLAARSAVSIDIEKDLTDRAILKFSQNTYIGSIDSTNLAADSIVLSSGYEPGTQFILNGDFKDHFTLTPHDNNAHVLSLSLTSPLPVAATENTFIVLEVEARRERAVSGWTSVVIEIIRQEVVAPVFAQAYYRGAYSTESGLQFNQEISLSHGYDETVSFDLEGEFRSLFSLNSRGPNSLSIIAPAPIANDLLQAHNQFILTVVATKPGTLAARSAVSIDIEKDLTDRAILRFSQNTYIGSIDSTNLAADSIVLSSGYEPGTQFILNGDFKDHFTLTPHDNNAHVLSLSLISPLPVAATENTFIVLEVEARRERAVSGWTSVVIEITRQEVVAPVFAQAYYRGAYSAESGLQFNQEISLSHGYDETVSFDLDGEFRSLFSLNSRGPNSLSIIAPAPIANDLLQAHNQFILAVIATKPGTLASRSAVFIDIEKDSQTGHDVLFGRYLYRGEIDQNDVRHDAITLTGYDGTTVEILGDYYHLFEGQVSDGRVVVQAREPLTLPSGVTTLALELRAGPAGTALLLRVLEGSDEPSVPTVTFSSESYVVSVDTTQTGLVGRVSATADTGEELSYSLGTVDAHLQTRLSITNEGELHLSAPAYSGVYTFQAIATTVESGATGTATVHLTVHAVTVCDDNGVVMDPLIILDRDEEVPHSNLVVLDPTLHAGCHFTLTNRWPIDQTWLYVNENGLHTMRIDREHASIAFMPLSQVQVELTLHCESDSALRQNLSERTERLGNYGSNKWILTDTILYNSRRSLVNLIVNDINDNNPIFVGKENEPIAVGYPNDELEERILPRSLAELKATDADIGENAALRYWSAESVLAVAPTTGFVHVRSGAQLRHDQLLTVSATDRNGEGLSGTIQLVVKLLEMNHIAVVTIRNAFLDDETTILAQLSDAVGYEVKTLRSVVISDDIDADVTRNKRETGTPRASLQLYVYGINEREPVTVARLSADITSNAEIANVASTIPLEDHLQDMNILDRQIGLLVATIILSILLFAVMLLVAIWFFLRWRKNKNYEAFNNESSVASRNASLGELPNPEVVKPRLNIEDLRRSEKRLQEMLHAPIEEVTVEPVPKKVEAFVEAILDLPIVEPSAPIVIQSIDKLKDAEESSDDEFGEVNAKPRKSVVTFNENVEKIIHVEDNDDDDGDIDIDDVASINANVDASNSGLEIYRF